MQCKNHPNRKAENFCASCGIPICRDCSEEATPGQYFCFQCAMFQTVSGVGTSLKEKKDKAAEKQLDRKKKIGPFHYFVATASVLIIVMWGVILFGGQKAPAVTTSLGQDNRVLLFFVDGALKRYFRYEDNKFPGALTDMIPRYLPINEKDMPLLGKLRYQRISNYGYRLSLANPKPNEMNIIITPKGVEYSLPSKGR